MTLSTKQYLTAIAFIALSTTQVSCSNEEVRSAGNDEDEITEAAKLIISNNKLVNQLSNKIAGKAGEVAFNMIGQAVFPDLFSQDAAIDYEKIRSLVAEEVKKANIQQTDMEIKGGFKGLTKNLHNLKTEWIDRLKKEHDSNSDAGPSDGFVKFTRGQMLLIKGSFETQVNIHSAIASEEGMAKSSIATYVGLENLEQNARGLLALMESVLPEEEQAGSHTKLMKESAEQARDHINKWLPKIRLDQVTCKKRGYGFYSIKDDGDDNRQFKTKQYLSNFAGSNCNRYLRTLKTFINESLESSLVCYNDELGIPDPSWKPTFFQKIVFDDRGTLTWNTQLFRHDDDEIITSCEEGKAYLQANAKRTREPRSNYIFRGLLAIADTWIK